MPEGVLERGEAIPDRVHPRKRARNSGCMGAGGQGRGAGQGEMPRETNGFKVSVTQTDSETQKHLR